MTDDQYHLNETITHLKTALEQISVPVFGLNHDWMEQVQTQPNGSCVTDAETNVNLVRAANADLKVALARLELLKTRLS